MKNINPTPIIIIGFTLLLIGGIFTYCYRSMYLIENTNDSPLLNESGEYEIITLPNADTISYDNQTKEGLIATIINDSVYYFKFTDRIFKRALKHEIFIFQKINNVNNNESYYTLDRPITIKYQYASTWNNTIENSPYKNIIWCRIIDI